MPDRAIVHFDLDAFFVEVERLISPGLRGVPLVVGGGGDRGVVAAASYEARAYGVHSGMPGSRARELCPNAYFIRGNFASYSYYSDLVTQILAEEAPVLQKASIDEFYVDVTGLDRFFGCYKWAMQVKARVRREAGLNVSFALSSNKTVSKIATNEVKPNGAIQVPYGEERIYLAPLDISKMPFAGQKTVDHLRKAGIRTIGDLSALPAERVDGLLGKHGYGLWLRANGRDDSPVEPWSSRKSYSKENTYEHDTSDLTFLKAELIRLTTELVFDLRQGQVLTGCLTLKIRYANFETQSKQIQIPFTCADHELMPRVQALFDVLHQRGRPVRLMGVRFSKLIPGSYQLRLFDESMRMASLYTALDTIRDRYGLKAVHRAIF